MNKPKRNIPFEELNLTSFASQTSSTLLGSMDKVELENMSGEMLASTEEDKAKYRLPGKGIEAISYEVNSHHPAEDCDIITLKNGEEIQAKILEIVESEIKI